MRVMYFFSQSKDIELLRKQTEVEIRITEGSDWDGEVIAIGSCYPFKMLYEADSSILLKRVAAPV